MDSKIILITGSSSGIGEVTAKALAKQGHTIIIHGRNRAKTLAVCEEIKKETGNYRVDVLIADLLLLSDVERMADEFKSKYDRLDVLINNAGAIFGKERETTKEGLEKTMTLNLFAPFLLTKLLLDVLVKSYAARIVNVSSSAHTMSGKPYLDDIQLEEHYSLSAYGLSKLYLIWVTRHWVTVLNERGIGNVTVNSLHPGAISTNFGKASDKGFIGNLLYKLAELFYITAEKGAETTIYLATSKDVENITGKYFDKKKITKTDDRYYSPESEQIVWDYCEQIVASR